MTTSRIVVSGYLGTIPAGGNTWSYLQYVLGFHLLGHDTYYIEDTGVWPIYQSEHLSNIDYIAQAMSQFGLGDKWAYRNPRSGAWHGMDSSTVRKVLRSADVLVNVSCASVVDRDILGIPNRVLIDTDPMFTQIQYETSQAVIESDSSMSTTLEAHTHHFTFGENVGDPDSRVPLGPFEWKATRQPIVIDCWPVVEAPKRPRFTTVMNWHAGRTLEYEGESWGQKDVEFMQYLDLPRLSPDVDMVLAVGQTTGDAFPMNAVLGRGWTVLDATSLTDWNEYRHFIQESFAELSIAKETYVKSWGGWFSERSACYLASGRPVVTEDTGWSKILPSGDGLLAFCDLESAAKSVEAVKGDYGRHSRAARDIAETYFSSDIVLSKLLGAL